MKHFFVVVSYRLCFPVLTVRQHLLQFEKLFGLPANHDQVLHTGHASLSTDASVCAFVLMHELSCMGGVKTTGLIIYCLSFNYAENGEIVDIYWMWMDGKHGNVC